MRTRKDNSFVNLAPTKIAKGVDPERTKIKKPSLQELMMEAGEHLSGWTEPFHTHNYQNEMLRYADVQGQYNSWGNFAVNARSRYSRRRAMRRLYLDSELVQLITKSRPKFL